MPARHTKWMLGDADLEERKALYAEAAFLPDDLGRLLYLDQRSYMTSLITVLDKATMAAGVEARVAFLDHRIVEWSYTLSDDLKINRWTNKWLVKELASRSLPREIVHRSKVGFGVPVGEWLRNAKGLGRFLDLLRDRHAFIRTIIDGSSLERVIQEHLSRRKDYSEILWSLVSLELWYRMWIKRETLT